MIEDASRRATCCALIPGEDVLHPAKSDNAHSPLEVESPGVNDGRHGDSRKSDDSLGLEVCEEGQGVGSEMGSCIAVAG